MQLYYPVILDGATAPSCKREASPAADAPRPGCLNTRRQCWTYSADTSMAGSGIIYTPTFGANRVKLEGAGIFNSVRDYNLRLAAISKEAAAGRALVAAT